MTQEAVTALLADVSVWAGERTMEHWTRVTNDHAKVTFGMIVVVREVFAQATDALVQDEAEALERALRAKFERQTGVIHNSYFCGRERGGAALVETRTGWELHTTLNSADADLVKSEADCRAAVDLAREMLPGSQVRTLVEALYSAMTRILLAADLLKEQGTDRAAVVATAQKEVSHAAARVEAAIQRQARFIYFQGALVGTVLTVLLIIAVGIASARLWPSLLNTAGLAGACVFGALGAVVSIFQRMSKGTLVLDFNTSIRHLRILGGFRPLVGAVFGAVAQFALTAGAINATLGLFVLAGFAAGFSERFATDMIERAGQVISRLPH
ncbi:hypothetical protein [Kibdelosporangium phytohabitans]|uniref:Uncharacterized protein n=1 Tax=Kibdelosporangium phytohabitans TaxID=860235 RepID=A0A0N9HVQ8_9PSEU|nr:hypothetical protein [Kibdelosporangium phytohabitans]ALG07626.1 hypothetical protein AOZ06_12555 [Kibdelosporangium phytohabitans]MBE1471423.1 hypothetical protein [Kibdelosporangium phytohabitans]